MVHGEHDGDARRDGEHDGDAGRAVLADRSRSGPARGSDDRPGGDRLGGDRPGGDRPGGEIAIAFPERDPGALDDATELYLMEQHAAPDGTVTAQVLGWEREGDVVRVDYALPTGERERDRYRWPTPGRYDDSDFLALVRGLGYAPASAEHVAGEFARARKERGTWRLVTGRTDADDGRAGERPSRDGDPRSRHRDDGEPDRPRGGWVRSRLSPAVRHRLDGVDPMDLGTASVGLCFLAVALPASIAAATGGLTTGLTALGSALFLAAVAALWLALVSAVR